MNLTRYLLIRLAEESNEVGKEALKEAVYGIDDCYMGEPAAFALQYELADLLGVLSLLQGQPDWQMVVTRNPFPDLTPQQGYWLDRVKQKQRKVCHYILYSERKGLVQLTDAEKCWVSDLALQYIPADK